MVYAKRILNIGQKNEKINKNKKRNSIKFQMTKTTNQAFDDHWSDCWKLKIS